MKKAFTMIELVFVIVVIGILAAVIIPSTRTNPLQEAAIQVLSHIRYTQHLAMVDDKYDKDNLDSTDSVKWYKERWQIFFANTVGSGDSWAYTIFSDSAGDSTGVPSTNEYAVNPANPSKFLTGGYSIAPDHTQATKKLNIGMSYGITDVTFSASCNGTGASKRIAFDHLGRPIQGSLSSNTQAYDSDDLIQSDCDIILTHVNSDTITIRVQEETGFSCILNASGVCI